MTIEATHAARDLAGWLGSLRFSADEFGYLGLLCGREEPWFDVEGIAEATGFPVEDIQTCVELGLPVEAGRINCDIAAEWFFRQGITKGGKREHSTAIALATTDRFLESFRHAVAQLRPELGAFTRRPSDPIPRHAGKSSTSFHRLTYELAKTRYQSFWQMWDTEGGIKLILDDSEAVKHTFTAEDLDCPWPRLAWLMSDEFMDVEPIDSDYLVAGIEIEANSATTNHNKTNAELPRWDSDRRELWLDGAKIATYRKNAENAEAVLDAFEASQWLAKIDNPLDINSDLRSTLQSMNAKIAEIRFSSNGKDGVLWERIEP